MILLLILHLIVFTLVNLVNSTFNATCGPNLPECSEPLKCILGNCRCSMVNETTKKPIDAWFWSGTDCIPCPADYNTTFYKCYKVNILTSPNNDWVGAREQCQQSNGDLLVIRSLEEYQFFVRYFGPWRSTLMPQRSPYTATHFANFWLGTTLVSWIGDGTYQSLRPGLVLDKKSPYWCKNSSIFDLEPNYTGLKNTSERQKCVGLAVLPGGTVCMNDWFCTWDSYFICEIPSPTDNPTDDVASLAAAQAAEQPSNSKVYMLIGIGGLVLTLISIGIYFKCCKKKKIEPNNSNESTLSDL